MIDCALFEPDIAQNAGAIMRLGACFGVAVHIIHPAGFALSDRHFKRAGMDYLSRADLVEHADWNAFETWRGRTGRRLVALSTHGDVHLPEFAFQPDDVVLLGRESAGLPEFGSRLREGCAQDPDRAGQPFTERRGRGINRGIRGAQANRPASVRMRSANTPEGKTCGEP